MKTKLCCILLALCLLLTLSVSLTSCSLLPFASIAYAEINENGELILVYEDGSTQSVGVVVGKDGKDGKDGKNGVNGTNGTSEGSLVITSEGSSIPTASAKGLRSAVTIVCHFEATVQQGGWRPGSSGTTTKEYSSAGSGVIYQIDHASGDAFIITNYHVVYDASSDTANGISDDIRVYLYGAEYEEKAIEADYVGGSLYYDIAVLRVENSALLKSSNTDAVTVCNSNEIAIGEAAIAIGNAQGLGISVTAGIVSVDSEHITMTAADGKTEVSFRVMRVDTAINSGNSGGGLYNDEGELIGIVNAKIVYDGVENIGYAIPSNIAVSVAQNIIDHCFGTNLESVQRALLGITVSTVDSKAVYDAQTGLISIKETVSVYEVSDGSASDGVLREGDVLLSAVLNDKTTEITRQFHLIDLMLDLRVGDTLTLNILRNDTEKTVNITITQDCMTAY